MVVVVLALGKSLLGSIKGVKMHNFENLGVIT